MPDQNNQKPNPYFDEHHHPYNQHGDGIGPDNNQHHLKPNVLDDRALRAAQSQTTFAFVAGPLSLFFGGVLLGGAGALCAGLAYRKLRALATKSSEVADTAQKMLKSARTSLIICLVSVAINAVSLAFMYPVIMQMLQNGDYATMAGNMGAGTAAGTSTWG